MKDNYLTSEDEIFNLIPLIMVVDEDVLLPFSMILFQMKSLLQCKEISPFMMTTSLDLASFVDGD